MKAPRRIIGLGLAMGLAAARPAAAGDLKDLFFGEALYHALQGQFFDALQNLTSGGTAGWLADTVCGE